MDIEQLWYELSPYLYALAGMLALYHSRSGLPLFSGVLLLVASATILRLRWTNRRRQDLKVQKALQDRR